MESVQKKILDRLAEPGVHFVFQSEVAARSWLERTIEKSGRKALHTGRFVSWDAFKAECFPGLRDRTPVKKLFRFLFARSIMEENSRKPFLNAIIPSKEAQASYSFAKTVASALPGLGAVPEIKSPYIDDWKKIKERYTAFLDSHNLYESSWHIRQAEDDGRVWLLFYTDLTEDWDEYSDAIRRMSSIEVLVADGLKTEGLTAIRYPGLLEEIRTALLTIRSEAKDGMALEEMAITIGAADSSIPLLEREAEIAGIMLDTRKARPLSESAGGRLLADLIEVQESDASFDSMRKLLLDMSRPWKDRNAALNLIEFATKKHIMAQIPGDKTDIWERSMDRSIGDKERKLYKAIRSSALEISTAGSFGKLRGTWDAFRQRCLDEEGWSPAENDEIGRCMLELENLAQTYLDSGLEVKRKLASLWLEHLAETPYLAQSSGLGVPVYPFPLGAGICPKLHIGIYLPQGAAMAASRPLRFLRDNDRELAGVADRDLSRGLLGLLAVSGEKTIMGWSDEGPDGIRPAHPSFHSISPEEAVRAGLISEGSLSRFWLANADIERRATEAFPSQKQNAALAAEMMRNKNTWSSHFPDDPGIIDDYFKAMLVKERSTQEGKIRLSASMMEAWLSCPFKWLFGRLLGIEKKDTRLNFIDNLLLGNIYHRTMEFVFDSCIRENRSIVYNEDDSGSSRPSLDDLKDALEKAIAETGKKEGPFALTVLMIMKPFLHHSLKGAYPGILQILDGKKPVLAEKNLYAEVPGHEDAVLEGKSDIIATDDKGNAIIIDYKKKNLPQKKVLGLDDSGKLGKFQMPVYKALAKTAGMEASDGYYIAFESDEKNSWSKVKAFGDGNAAIPASMMEEIMDALYEACRICIEDIKEGHIYVPEWKMQEVVCQNCEIKSVCRVRYAVK